MSLYHTSIFRRRVKRCLFVHHLIGKGITIPPIDTAYPSAFTPSEKNPRSPVFGCEEVLYKAFAYTCKAGPSAYPLSHVCYIYIAWYTDRSAVIV
jgi:hypothetical protein